MFADRLRTTALAAGFALATTVGGAALAQQAPDQQTPDQQAPTMAPQAEFSQTQIQAFAGAAREVGEVQQSYDLRMQEAADAEEMQQLQQEAQNQMVAVVEEHGLSPDEYNAILQAAHADQALYQEIVQAMQTLE